MQNPAEWLPKNKLYNQKQRWIFNYGEKFGTVLPKFIDNQTHPERNQRRTDTTDDSLWRWNIQENEMPNSI